jgi:hypothetical protein
MPATRDLLRRRTPLMRQRAARLAHLPQTNRQDTRPELGKQRAAKANRAGVAERVPARAGQKRLAGARARINPDDRLLTALAWALVPTAKADQAQTCSCLRAMPGLGTSLALVWWSASHASHRVPRLQACVSSGRRGQSANASAGKRDGPSGQTRGKASRTWAFADAAGLGLRHHPAGPQDRARRTTPPGPGTAVTVLAHP